jgi:hypothetical protein
VTPIAAKGPIAEANRLSKLLSLSLGAERFPVDVEQLALGYAQQFGHEDGIRNVIGADLPGFEGALYRIEQDAKPGWALLYNSAIPVPGRIRFTIAHELGHYILHRGRQAKFECSQADMLEWESKEKQIESEADSFASYLLMPLDDFRRQIVGEVADLDLIEGCAIRYGVSLTAAILKWLEFTHQRAVLVMSRDGYVLWARSSEAARKSGAFIRTRGQVTEIPPYPLTASMSSAAVQRSGVERAAYAWFPHEPKDMSLREIRITSDRYDQTMSLLILPPAIAHWERTADDADGPTLDAQVRAGHFPKQ